MSGGGSGRGGGGRVTRCFRFVGRHSLDLGPLRELVASRETPDAFNFSRVPIPVDDPRVAGVVATARAELEALSDEKLCPLAINVRVVAVNASPPPDVGLENDEKGSFHPGFNWHNDQRKDERWLYTALFYDVRGVIRGGETIFDDDGGGLTRVAPATGRLLAFSSGPENTHRAGPTAGFGRRLVVQTQWGRPGVVVVHPFKTAGRFVWHAFQDAWGPPTECGGSWTRIHPIKTPRNALEGLRWSRLLVLLRDPVDRLLSEYAFFHAAPGDRCYAGTLPLKLRLVPPATSLEDFLARSRADHQIRFLLGEDDCDDSCVERALSLLEGAVVAIKDDPILSVENALRQFGVVAPRSSGSAFVDPPCPHLSERDLADPVLLRLALAATTLDRRLVGAIRSKRRRHDDEL
ncbi:hypothetical protein CTAYLR_008959 [Chrysophaeum taylorii]|uniref:Fe2OG dioxygenase domain-containing protein n=1 Tax=Chrysophaeum taylorii TaxID=2483200 RepID=A0AAD7UNX6_9STRA|nr:hypothetical protein CTAYLR_008959 [Chrysophaeum taylorii]